MAISTWRAMSSWRRRSLDCSALWDSILTDSTQHTPATPEPRSRKRTYAYVLRSMRTLRFLLVVRRPLDPYRQPAGAASAPPGSTMQRTVRAHRLGGAVARAVVDHPDVRAHVR